MQLKPLYETDDDRSREREVFSVIEQRFDCECRKLPVSWQVDFVGERYGEGVCLGEVKCRTHNKGAHDTVIMSKHKLSFGIRLAQFFGIPMMCFWKFMDGHAWWKAPMYQEGLDAYRAEKWRARNHWADLTDEEYIIHIPTKELRDF